MFFVVPLSAGFAIAVVTDEPNRASAAASLATLVSLVILVAGGYETVLCAVLVWPLLLVALIAGIVLGILFRNLARKFAGRGATFTSLALILVPVAIISSHRVEEKKLIHPRLETVTSTIRFTATPDEVWANLRSFDSLSATKPFLMYVGLPIPIRCEMRGTGVGSARTCYFDKGYIEETVTKWTPPNVMGLAIDRTNLPGRHWLGFETARYELHREGNETVLTRTTKITSNLYPAMYWRPFERWGVASEHEYIFSDLARRLSGAAFR